MNIILYLKYALIRSPVQGIQDLFHWLRKPENKVVPESGLSRQV